MMSLINRIMAGLLAVRLGHNVDTAVTVSIGREPIFDIPKNLFGVFFEEARAIALLWLIGGRLNPSLKTCPPADQPCRGRWALCRYPVILDLQLLHTTHVLSPATYFSPITRSYGILLPAELVNDRSFEGLAFENGFLDSEATQTELPFPLPAR